MAYTTRPSLLEALKKGELIDWLEFQEMYRPLVQLRAKDYKLNPQETEELMQQVLLDIFHGCKTFRYDPAKGRFRDYMRLLIARNCIDIKRKRHPKLPEVPNGDALLAGLPAEEDQHAWDEEWRQLLLEQAKAMLRKEVEPATFLAYEMYAEQNLPVEQVAKYLDMTTANVYLAKSRCLERLQQIVRQLESE